jgi:hypothetical protein
LCPGRHPAVGSASSHGANGSARGRRSGQGKGRGGSEQFRARLNEAAHAIENDPRFASFSQQQRKDLVEFVGGNMLFVLTHELGHALIGEMDLYVLGREEDAADTFAVTRMIDIGTDVSDHVLVQAATAGS